MNTRFATIDYVILMGYAVILVALGIFLSRNKKGKEKTTEDYFLAGKSLVWWAIGTSCIAANISAEQLIGMSGSGFVMGLAMASYEFASAIILIFVGKFFLPIFIKKQIYTMPQFLEMRFDKRVRSSLASFWILLYVFVNLTSIMYMGALAVSVATGIPFWVGIVILAGIAIAYSVYGGLTAVAWTDIIQVVLLVGGGVITTYLALNIVSEGHGIIVGAKKLFEIAPEKFHMVFSKDHPNYKEIPGMLGIIVGIILVANSYYWGFNQYTIQRALAAKSIKHAQHGVMFAGYLKLIMPILVVVPGIAAYVIVHDPELLRSLGHINMDLLPTKETADRTYPWLLGLLPKGIKGLAFAALAAAIVSSLASMINSTATIFTMDIYKPYIKKTASEKHYVSIGRLTSILALLIACMIAPALRNVEQAFQFIQEFTGFISPGIVAIFILGMFWKRTTSNAALWMAGITLPISLSIYYFTPHIPFLNRMGITLGIILLAGILCSLIDTKHKVQNAIEIEPGLFKTSIVFNIGSIIILGILTAFYIVFW